MPVVKVDEKGRIQLPKALRHELHLKPRQSLNVQKQGEVPTVSKVGNMNLNEDPLLKDIIHHPLKSKIRITKSLLNRLEEKQWSS